MGIEIHRGDGGATVTIVVKGRFDFGLVKEFRHAYEDTARAQRYILDMHHTDHLDSSALGMLLNMRSFLGGDQANISIVGCSPGVRRVFDIARFDKRFKFE